MRTYCILSREQIPSFSKVIAKVLVTILLAVLISPISGLADVVNLTPTKDTFVEQAAPAKKFGGWKQLKTRQEVTSKGFFGRPATTGGARETLLQFDLSGIPQDAEITAAYLKLYSNKNKNFRKDNATRVYAVLEPWLQSTTWNGKPATASTYEDSIAVNGFGQYAQWDITNLVKDWVSGLEQNHGVVVRSEGGGELYFASKEAPDPGKRPVLYIEYTNPGVGESLNVTVEANPTSGEAPLSVNFTANVPDGSTGMEYRWDFEGDGIVDVIGSSNQVSYTYNDSGEYNASVEVFTTSTATADAGGSSLSASSNGRGKGSAKVKVTTSANPEPTPTPAPNQPPTLNLQASPSSGTTPLTVTFESNASDPNGSIVEYRWDTNGDGTVDEVTSSNPYTFIYLTSGTYTVKVTVVDNGGLTASGTTTVVVSPPPTPSPTPTPAPTPAPTPTPNPEPDLDTGVSDAPAIPANTRIIIVAKDGSGDYTSIQAALNNSQPGDTIQVKNGTYNEAVHFDKSGTPEEPIALVNYPLHSPVIKPGGSKPLTDVTNSQRVDIRADWIILQGFEITNGWDGITANNHQQITIRGNYIHHNHNQGIYTGSSSDVLIEDNIVEWNGVDTCNIGDGLSPRHCHGMYLNSHISPVSNLTIRRNLVQNHGGTGILVKTTNTTYGHTNDLVENNIVVDNSNSGIALFYNITNSNVRNNTVVQTNLPSSNSTDHYLLKVWPGSSGNVIKNNIFYTTLSNVRGLLENNSNSSLNTYDYNLWKVVSNSWRWNNSDRSDFSTKYQSTSGDIHGKLNVDPKFIDTTNGQYQLSLNSPARDAGQNSSCTSKDFDGDARPYNVTCDIGMDEYRP